MSRVLTYHIEISNFTVRSFKVSSTIPKRKTITLNFICLISYFQMYLQPPHRIQLLQQLPTSFTLNRPRLFFVTPSSIIQFDMNRITFPIEIKLGWFRWRAVNDVYWTTKNPAIVCCIDSANFIFASKLETWNNSPFVHGHTACQIELKPRQSAVIVCQRTRVKSDGLNKAYQLRSALFFTRARYDIWAGYCLNMSISFGLWRCHCSEWVGKKRWESKNCSRRSSLAKEVSVHWVGRFL